MALVLEKEDAVDAWRELLGPMELDVAQIEAPDRLFTALFYPLVVVVVVLYTRNYCCCCC